MSVSIEPLEGRTFFSASPSVVELRSDVSTLKVEVLSVSKSLKAEVKTMLTDFKRVKASKTDATLVNKSLKSSVTTPVAQLTKSLNALTARAAAFDSANQAYMAHGLKAYARFSKAGAALTQAYATESTLANDLATTRLTGLSTTVTGLATSLGDATTAQDAATLNASVTADNAAISANQLLIQTDISNLDSSIVANA